MLRTILRTENFFFEKFKKKIFQPPQTLCGMSLVGCRYVNVSTGMLTGGLRFGTVSFRCLRLTCGGNFDSIFLRNNGPA